MEQGARRRRMPAWGWVLVGISGLMVVVGAGGYAAYVSGVLPAALDLMAVPYVGAYLPAAAAALVVGLILAALIGYATAGRGSARGRRAPAGDDDTPLVTPGEPAEQASQHTGEPMQQPAVTSGPLR